MGGLDLTIAGQCLKSWDIFFHGTVDFERAIEPKNTEKLRAAETNPALNLEARGYCSLSDLVPKIISNNHLLGPRPFAPVWPHCAHLARLGWADLAQI